MSLWEGYPLAVQQAVQERRNRDGRKGLNVTVYLPGRKPAFAYPKPTPVQKEKDPQDKTPDRS